MVTTATKWMSSGIRASARAPVDRSHQIAVARPSSIAANIAPSPRCRHRRTSREPATRSPGASGPRGTPSGHALKLDQLEPGRLAFRVTALDHLDHPLLEQVAPEA